MQNFELFSYRGILLGKARCGGKIRGDRCKDRKKSSIKKRVKKTENSKTCGGVGEELWERRQGLRASYTYMVQVCIVLRFTGTFSESATPIF